MLRNGFLESKFVHSKSPRFLQTHYAEINFKHWIDMNTKGSSQITRIKETPQKQHLAESCLATQLKDHSILWGLSGKGMGDVTRHDKTLPG